MQSPANPNGNFEGNRERCLSSRQHSPTPGTLLGKQSTTFRSDLHCCPLALAWKVLCSEQPEELSMAALPYASVLHIPIREPWTLNHTMAAMGPLKLSFHLSFYTTTESEAFFNGGVDIVMPTLDGKYRGITGRTQESDYWAFLY